MPLLKKVKVPEVLRSKKVKMLSLLALAAIILLLLGVPTYVTSQTSFFANEKSLKQRYDTWRTSSHKKIACLQCHLEPGGALLYRIENVRDFYGDLFSRTRKAEVFDQASSEACFKCHLENPTKYNSGIPLIPHKIHKGSLGTQKNCVECHKWLVHDEKFQERHKSLPLTGVCFKYGCHGEVERIEECRSCHHTESIPSTDWRKQHPEIVNAGGANRCFDYCHKPDWCRNCHLTGQKTPLAGPGTTSIQPSSTLISRHAGKEWIRFHGQEALANSKTCLACHANYQLCENCHSIRPKSHGPKLTWLARHKKLAEGNERDCLTCHQKKACDQCHELFKDVGR